LGRYLERAALMAGREIEIPVYSSAFPISNRQDVKYEITFARDWFRYRSTVHLQTQAAAQLSSEVRQHADESRFRTRRIIYEREAEDFPAIGQSRADNYRLYGRPWRSIGALTGTIPAKGSRHLLTSCSSF
jgi:hypothetical protein